MSRPRDTSPAAQRRQTEAIRAMSPTERLRLADEMSTAVRALTEAGIRRRRPNLTGPEVNDALTEIVLGPEIAAAARLSPAR